MNWRESKREVTRKDDCWNCRQGVVQDPFSLARSRCEVCRGSGYLEVTFRTVNFTEPCIYCTPRAPRRRMRDKETGELIEVEDPLKAPHVQFPIIFNTKPKYDVYPSEIPYRLGTGKQKDGSNCDRCGGVGYIQRVLCDECGVEYEFSGRGVFRPQCQCRYKKYKKPQTHSEKHTNTGS